MNHGKDIIAKWHRIVADRDFGGIAPLLADDIILHSPIVHTPQNGKASALPYLQAAFFVFLNESFTYVREVVGENDAILEFQLELEGIIVNGVDIIKWNEDGLICDFKVMLRPLKAVNLIHEKMAAMLASRSESS